MHGKNTKAIRDWAIVGAGVVLFVVALTSLGSSAQGGALLPAQDFMTKYQATAGAVLLDVRTPAEFNAGHIPNAVNVDYENPNFAAEAKALDPSKTYFIYCRSGNRSARADAIMKGDGIAHVYELQGGIISAPALLQ